MLINTTYKLPKVPVSTSLPHILTRLSHLIFILSTSEPYNLTSGLSLLWNMPPKYLLQQRTKHELVVLTLKPRFLCGFEFYSEFQ